MIRMQLFSETDNILNKYNYASSSIIQVLSDLQAVYGYLPFEELEKVSEALNLSLAKIFGIITFYADFKLNKPGKYNIKSCHGTACYVKNVINLQKMLVKTTEQYLSLKENIVEKLVTIYKKN